MSLRLSPEIYAEEQALETEVQLSYFTRKRNEKPSRIGYAKLLDISNAGLCMEIPQDGPELYMESRDQLFLVNKTIDLQIFCRSCSANVSIEGRVKWIKWKEETVIPEENEGICVGVLFSFTNADQRRDLAELVSVLKTDTISCADCGAPVSSGAALCYNCGTRLVRKRAFLRKIIDNLLAGKKNPT